MSTTLVGVEGTADISTDGLYRYALSRRWGDGIRHATFVMLNPSTADATKDDATIRRCIGFAKMWRCSGLYVVNAYALRAINPKRLWEADDPVGPDNDEYLTDYARRAAKFGWPLIAAWGVNAKPARVEQVLALYGMEYLQSLGVTKDGSPRHPLYLRSDAAPSPWPVRGAP